MLVTLYHNFRVEKLCSKHRKSSKKNSIWVDIYKMLRDELFQLYLKIQSVCLLTTILVMVNFQYTYNSNIVNWLSILGILKNDLFGLGFFKQLSYDVMCWPLLPLISLQWAGGSGRLGVGSGWLGWWGWYGWPLSPSPGVGSEDSEATRKQCRVPRSALHFIRKPEKQLPAH